MEHNKGENLKITKNVSTYIAEMGISLSSLSKKTGIPYGALYASLSCNGRGRELKANEFISICITLNINPMDIACGGRNEKNKKV